MTIRRTAAAVAVLATLLTGCSIANTAASEVALQYEAGPLDSRTYYSCVPGGTREINDINDDHFYYPAGQRDFTFGSNEGADMAALTSTTQDAQEISVSGTVKLTLTTDCSEFKDPTGKVWPGGKLQFFHELIASKYEPSTDAGEMPAKWRELLGNYVGASLDRATDNEALKYGQMQLYTDTAKKAQWEQDVLKQLPEILKTLTQGVDLFTINAVLLQKPAVQQKIVDGLTDVRAAELRNQAAEVDKLASVNFPGGIAGYQAYQQQQAINQAIKDGKVQVLPVPQGSPIIVQAR